MGMLPPSPPPPPGRLFLTGPPEMDLEKIEELVKDFERQELLEILIHGERDTNVEESLQEVLMILKLLHSEKVGKRVFERRERLLMEREHILDEMKRAKQIKSKKPLGKWTTGFKWLDKSGMNNRVSGGGTGPF